MADQKAIFDDPEGEATLASAEETIARIKSDTRIKTTAFNSKLLSAESFQAYVKNSNQHLLIAEEKKTFFLTAK